MTQRWDVNMQCVRATPEGDRCEGRVRCHGYYDAGSMYGGRDHMGSPPEGESIYEPCDICGAEEWTEREEAAYDDLVRRELDDRDSPQY